MRTIYIERRQSSGIIRGGKIPAGTWGYWVQFMVDDESVHAEFVRKHEAIGHMAQAWMMNQDQVPVKSALHDVEMFATKFGY